MYVSVHAFVKATQLSIFLCSSICLYIRDVLWRGWKVENRKCVERQIEINCDRFMFFVSDIRFMSVHAHCNNRLLPVSRLPVWTPFLVHVICSKNGVQISLVITYVSIVTLPVRRYCLDFFPISLFISLSILHILSSALFRVIFSPPVFIPQCSMWW